MHHPGSLAFAEGQLEPQLRIVSGFAGGNKPSADSALAGSRELPQGIGCISTIPALMPPDGNLPLPRRAIARPELHWLTAGEA